MVYMKGNKWWKTLDWWTIGIYLVLIMLGWLSVCGASYDYGEPNFFDISTRAGKQIMWIGCSLGLGFVLLMLDSPPVRHVCLPHLRDYDVPAFGYNF